MISSLGKHLSRWSERYVPDPFVLVLILTVITGGAAFFLGVDFQQAAPAQRLSLVGSSWFSEFYDVNLMRFALQMIIVLVTGHALAMSQPVRRAIRALTKLVVTPGAAVVVVALVACLASMVQWGLGAIAGAFMAREMGRAFAIEGRPVHYPLLGAAGYGGFLIWHGGLSGTAPLTVAQADHFLVDTLGQIPVSETLFSNLNLMVTGSLLVIIPLLFWRLTPKDPDQMQGFPTDKLDDEGKTLEVVEPNENAHPVVRFLEGRREINIVIGLAMMAVLVNYFADHGVDGWHLDTINLLFLTLGILAHPSPRSYVAAITDGAKGAAGIILQFPFYFGILGILRESGLIAQLSEFFTQISTATTYPLFTFLSAGIVNFFVPSGGGQWAVQGPVMMEAIEGLGVEPHRAIMALSYGDAWTNMLQPFWALPLLGIMGLKARDIIGYTGFVFLVTGPWIMFLLIVL